jgi:hypothetical protein
MSSWGLFAPTLPAATGIVPFQDSFWLRFHWAAQIDLLRISRDMNPDTFGKIG